MNVSVPNLLISLVPLSSAAHPGDTDAKGCHTCRTNCREWGLQFEEYHCHAPKEDTSARASTGVVGLYSAAPLTSTRKPVPHVILIEVNRLPRDIEKILRDEKDAIPCILTCPGQHVGEEIPIRVTFQTGSSSLTPAARARLEAEAERLVHEGKKVEVTGYTSATGSKEYNLELSRQRAEVVRAYLIEQGVNPLKVVANGYGSANPIASNATYLGREANQRIELHYLE